MVGQDPEGEALLLQKLRQAVRNHASQDLRFVGYYRLLSAPVLGDWYIRSRPPLRQSQVTSSTDIVIDGFPRSANSMARVMLEQLQDRPIRISSHLHTPRSITTAIALNIPRLVLIRDPDDAVASLLQLQPGLTAGAAFRVYHHFYHRLLPHVDELTVGHFPDVVSDFGQVIERVNQMHHTTFTTAKTGLTTTSETVFSEIDRRLELFDSEADSETLVARPSSHRKAPAAVLADLTRSEKAAQASARMVYRSFLEKAGE